MANVAAIDSLSINFAVMGTVILIGVLADGQLQRFRRSRAAKTSGPAAAVAAPQPQLGHEG